MARVANIGETIRRLKEQGVFVYCADMDGVPLRKNNLTGPIALVLGSEGSGVSQLVKSSAMVWCGWIWPLRHRCGQLQCLGGGWHHPVRDPEPARRRVRNSGQTAVTRTGRD